MLNRLLQAAYRAPNNGRQVISRAGGPLLLVTHSQVAEPGRVGLRAASSADPARWSDFAAQLDLVGSGGVLAAGDGPGLGGCALVDDEDVLHLAWTAADGIRHAAVPAAAALDPGSWSAAVPAVTGDTWLGDLLLYGGRPCVLYREVSPSSETGGIGLAVHAEGAWSARHLWDTEPTYPPVAHADGDGRLHVTWGDVAGRLWYAALTPEGVAESAPLLLSLEGRQPAITAVPDGVLIVYEDRYPHVHYKLVRERKAVAEGPLTWRHPWFMGDLVHSPQLSVDRHGVAWCFFVDNTRRSTFWARWMGDGFGAVTNGPRVHFRPPHFDWNLLPIARLSVEKHAPGDHIGMLLGLEPPLTGQEFRRVTVPDHPRTPGSTVLFLDGLEVGAARGVSVQVQQAQRHEANPLLDVGPPDGFDSDRVYNHGAVLCGGGRFRMWYGAIREQGPQVPWWDTISAGYAESDDGIAWKRVNLGDTNQVPHLRHSPLMVRDDADPDPARRYKSLYVWNSGEMGEMAASGKYGRDYDPRDESYPAILFTSPDGLQLTPHEARIVFADGVAKPFSIIPQSLFRDDADPDPARRWKAYGFMSLNLRRRGSALLYSADALTWYAHAENPVLDPSVRGTPAVVGGPESQIHDTVVFPYAGYYVALYQNQHDAEHLDIELAVSRDGETFTHVQPGAKILPLGSPGAFDAEHLVQTTPVVLDDEIRIYYGGGCTVDVPASEQERRGPRALRFLPGLACLRRDGFTRVGLKEGASSGVLTTVPFVLPAPCQLTVNADCDAARHLRVEVRGAPDEQALEGYCAEDSLAIVEDDLDLPVRWRDRTQLPAGTPLRLCFHFTGDAVRPGLFAYRLSP